MIWDSNNQICALGFGDTVLAHDAAVDVFWTNAIHGATGNILYTDGAVEQLSTAGLQHALGSPYLDDNGGYHFLAP
jgi:prepilin-type processing-associated H-X9-DG protein